MTKSSSVAAETEEEWNEGYEPIVRIATIGSTKPDDQQAGVLKHRLQPSVSVTSGKSDKAVKSDKGVVKVDRAYNSDKSQSHLKTLTPPSSKRNVQRPSTHEEIAHPHSLQHRMHFDFMGGANDERSRAEFGILMEALLGRYQNCCLMHFNNMRRCQKNFLHNLLVSELERRLPAMQTKLLGIELVYYDVRKHNNFNIFSPLAKAIRKFRTLQQLLKWLRVDYSHLWSDGRWHEYFKFKFNLLDVKQRERNAKFDFIQIYLCCVDRTTKRELSQLLQDGVSTPQVRSNRKTAGYSPLTEDLTQYFGNSEAWCTSIVFDVSHNGGKISDAMLQLANAAYDGLKAKWRQVEDKRKNKTLRKVWSHEKYLSPAADTSLSCETSKQSPTERSSNEPSTDELTESWILEIDEKFDDLFAVWKDYYDAKHHKTVRKWCKDVRDMTVTAEKSGVDVKESSDEYKAPNVGWHYDNYKAAQIQLRSLIKDVEARPKCEKLKVYLESKSQKLCEDTVSHKVKQLQLCKARISSAIKNEISALRF